MTALAGPLVIALICALAGCQADSAKPGTVCSHCDYRFSYFTPNPCDPCQTGVDLPYYGYTLTSWEPWPTEEIHLPPNTEVISDGLLQPYRRPYDQPPNQDGFTPLQPPLPHAR